MKKGIIIVLDGMDGVGKNTQSKLIIEKLKEKHDKVAMFSFPNYDSDSSILVRKFLSGEVKLDNVFAVSIAYALDRYITYTKDIKKLYEKGYIIVLDRFYLSNILYQLHKIETYGRKMEYIDFVRRLEIESLELPIPDKSIILYSDPEVSNNMINGRYNNDDSMRDIYENCDMQNNVYNNIKFIEDNKNLHLIHDTIGSIETYCIHDNENNLKSIEEINIHLMDIIETVIRLKK